MSGKQKKIYAWIIVTAALSLPTHLVAQNLWERVNGLLRVQTKAVAINRNGDIFVATRQGVFRSLDDGRTWTTVNNGLHNVVSLALLIDARNNIFLGAAEGLYQSKDNGANWERLNLTINTFFPSVKILAMNSEGHLFAGVELDHVYRSLDNGKSWKKVSPASFDSPSCLAINSKNEIFAGAFNGGLFRSTDNGENWTAINNGLSGREVLSITISANDHVFVGTPRGGIYRTTDNGENWMLVNKGILNDDIWGLAYSPKGYLFAIGVGKRVYHSSDNGDSWTAVTLNHVWDSGDALTVDAHGRVYFGRGGVSRSNDNGKTWEFLNTGFLAPKVRALAADDDGCIFAGAEAAFYEDDFFRSRDGGKNWEKSQIDSVYKTILALTLDKNGYVYAGVWNSGVFRSIDHGKSWSKLPLGLNFLEILSLAVNSKGHIFVVTFAGLFRSIENNGLWTTIKINFPNSYAERILIKNDTIFVGASGVFRSDNNGETWTPINDGFTEGGRAYAFAVDQHGSLFIARGSRVFYSSDNGGKWIQLGPRLPVSDVAILSLAVNSNNQLFAGTHLGAFLLDSAGTDWTPINSGLGYGEVRALLLDKNERLFAGTSGSGLFRSVSPTTAVKENGSSERYEYDLKQNYPNPFNPSTTFQFTLKFQAQVKLTLYDVIGSEVATVINKPLQAGKHTIEWNAGNLPSGLYFYRFTANNFTKAGKLILLR